MTDPTPRTPSVSDTDAVETQIERSNSTRFGGYELLAEVARGGMGVVYKARHTALDRIVALKLVLTGSDASESELSRFQIEAKAAARLDHPHIVPVYEIGEHDGQHFFSMGFVDGPSLSVRLAKSGPLPPSEAADLVRKVAEAVDYAHRQGVIHRDLKPGNVLLMSAGEPKVTDFGLAKRLDSEQSLTATGQILGTSAYMAPEQAQGNRALIGPATDIYSLGATLFAALTGRPPFTATAIHELLIQVSEEPPPSLRTINSKVPAALETICLKCLAKEPADRYSSAGALAEDLKRFLDLKRVNASRRSSAAKVLAVAAVVLIAVVLFMRQGAVSPSSSAAGSPDATPTTDNDSSSTTQLSAADEQLLRSLDAAQETLLSSLPEDIWQYRYSETATACEQTFREFGFTAEQDNVPKLAASLKRHSSEFRESVICGLELWELCAVADQQTTVIETLRQAQDALDSLGWRRSLRLARADADEKIILQIVRDSLTESPTPAQIELMALLIGSRSPEKNPEVLGVLRNLVQESPQNFVANLVLAATLQAIGWAKPTEMATYANEALVPLRAAAKARSTSPLPHEQLAAVYADLGNAEAADKERAQTLQLQSPETQALIVAARKARNDRQAAELVLRRGGSVVVSRPDESSQWVPNPLNADSIVLTPQLTSIQQLPKDKFVLRSAMLGVANDQDVQRLANCSDLQCLSLWKCAITDKTIDSLKGFSQLRLLGLVGGNITATGVAQFKESKSIEYLDLGLIPLKDDVLPAVGEMHQLVYLSLFGTQITDAGIDHLFELKALKTLVVGETKITAAGLARIRQALPNCKLL